MSDDLVTWLRAQILADKQAAQLISAGGYAPQRWDTDPPGQVNPENMAERAAINALLNNPAEEDPAFMADGHWVAIYSWDCLNIEPEGKRVRDSDLPVAIVNDGRREVDHMRRHDPRFAVADCEAKLAILDEHDSLCVGCHDDRRCPRACRTIRHLGSGYQHRPGYRQEWKP